MRLLLHLVNKYWITLQDFKVETVSWSISVLKYSRTSQNKIPKGELFIRKGDSIHLNGNESTTMKFNTLADHVAPLGNKQYALLGAISTPSERLAVFETDGWMDWGEAVKKGDNVYIRVPMKDNIEGCCSTARVQYIGCLSNDQQNTMFGVEIKVSYCYYVFLYTMEYIDLV